MIRRLETTDAPQLAEFLYQSPYFNLYMLGNLAALGVAGELSEFWGDFEPGDSGTLRGVINRYMTGWSVFGTQDADWQGLAEILDHYPTQAERLQDNPVGTESFGPYLSRYGVVRTESETLMHLPAAQFRPVPPPRGANIRRATSADYPALVEFYAHAGNMQRTPKGVERPLKDGYLFIAEIDGEIGAAALTNAITHTSAMIGGVYTTPSRRGQGLSQAVCSELCTSLIRDGRTPCLYWIAPDAGRVYDKLGFEAVGTWRSSWLAPTPQPQS